MKTENQQAPTNKLKLILLIGIPLLLVLSLALVFGKKQYQEEEQFPPVEEEQEEVVSEQYLAEPINTPTPVPPTWTQAQIDEYNRLAPTNPNTVKAYSDSTKAVELSSGQVYSYPNPYFEWSGAQVNEPGVEIRGYLVSFGEEHRPRRPTARVTGNSFSPNEYGLTLEKGQTYKLFVQTNTNSERAPLGMDLGANKPAVAIFEYIYQ